MLDLPDKWLAPHDRPPDHHVVEFLDIPRTYTAPIGPVMLSRIPRDHLNQVYQLLIPLRDLATTLQGLAQEGLSSPFDARHEGVHEIREIPTVSHHLIRNQPEWIPSRSGQARKGPCLPAFDGEPVSKITAGIELMAVTFR